MVKSGMAIGTDLNYGIAVRREIVWCDWPEKADRLRPPQSDDTHVERRAWLLILDDVGAEHDPSGFVAAKLSALGNARLGKWTVITSNYTLEAFCRCVDQRIASRMIRDRNEVREVNTVDFCLRNRQ